MAGIGDTCRANNHLFWFVRMNLLVCKIPNVWRKHGQERSVKDKAQHALAGLSVTEQYCSLHGVCIWHCMVFTLLLLWLYSLWVLLFLSVMKWFSKDSEPVLSFRKHRKSLSDQGTHHRPGHINRQTPSLSSINPAQPLLMVIRGRHAHYRALSFTVMTLRYVSVNSW